jgi:hypothetical protein
MPVPKGNQKMMKILWISAALILLCLFKLPAQVVTTDSPRLLVPRVARIHPLSAPIFAIPSLFVFATSTKSAQSILFASQTSPAPFYNRYSVETLPFFCKLEVKLERAVKIPVKFRLGDVQYVDRLEGKTQR